jgi:hypothetical protein
MKGVHFWDPNVKKEDDEEHQKMALETGPRGAQEPREELGSRTQIPQRHHLPPARGGISTAQQP